MVTTMSCHAYINLQEVLLTLAYKQAYIYIYIYMHERTYKVSV